MISRLNKYLYRWLTKLPIQLLAQSSNPSYRLTMCLRLIWSKTVFLVIKSAASLPNHSSQYVPRGWCWYPPVRLKNPRHKFSIARNWPAPTPPISISLWIACNVSNRRASCGIAVATSARMVACLWKASCSYENSIQSCTFRKKTTSNHNWVLCTYVQWLPSQTFGLFHSQQVYLPEESDSRHVKNTVSAWHERDMLL